MSDNVTRKEFHHALKDINRFFAKKKDVSGINPITKTDDMTQPVGRVSV